MEKTKITHQNCEEVAHRLVEHLFDRPLAIVSFYQSARVKEEPKTVTGVKLLGGFTFTNGRLRIPLHPRRKLFWDLSKEEVWVTFMDDESVVIERHLPKEKIIFRVVVKF